MKVSVIIPVYNGEKTIIRCLNSVLSQTLREIEIIVINDGSTDKTGELLKQFQDNITIIEQENKGQGIARNKGILASKGEYIGFVDADDTIEPNMYAVMYQKAKEHAVDVVQCNLMQINCDGTVLERETIEDSIVVINDKADYFCRYVFHNIHSMECCNKLIKASFLEENHFEFKSNEEIYAEDLLLNMQMILVLKKICFIHQSYYNYYIGPNSHSRQKSVEKVTKIYRLFGIVSEKINDKKLYREVSKFAVLIILLNLSQVMHTDSGKQAAKILLKQKRMKRYLISSFFCMKKLHHKLIMFSLFTMPMGMKLMITQRYYQNIK